MSEHPFSIAVVDQNSIQNSGEKTDRVPVSHAGVFRFALGIISLGIYISLALLHHQSDDRGGWLAYGIERTAMASAVSDIVYGAPLASVYHGVFNAFVRPALPLDALFEKAKQKDIEPLNLFPYNPDGMGAGEAIFVTAAMRIFGVRTLSILWAFLSLISVATIAFLSRFHDRRSLVVVASLTALSVMFASQLGGTIENISQIPVAGYRYFSLLAAIPGMHIFLELIDHEASPRPWVKDLPLLVVQFIVFFIAFYTNVAAIYLYGPFVFGIAYASYRLRRDRVNKTARLCKLLLIVGVAASTLIASRHLAPQAYKDTGRDGDMIWSRIFVAMGANPHWPFGNLAEAYKGCVPWLTPPDRGLIPGIRDNNLSCVWNDYARRHNISQRQMSEELFGGNYNAVLEATLYKVARMYPIDTLLTFIYYKPLMLGGTLLSLFHFHGPVPWWVVSLILVQLLVLLAFAWVEAATQSSICNADVYVTLGLAGICTCGLYIVAWSVPWTTGDLFFYLLALIAAGVVTLFTLVLRSLSLSNEAPPQTDEVCSP